LDKDIKDLIDYVSKSNFVEFEFEKDGFKIKLVKKGAKVVVQSTPASETAIASKPDKTKAPSQTLEAATPEVAEDREGLIEIKSPIVGTFYRAANPSASPFVEVGMLVKKGQILCIVEAMKLMNEIESEIAGEVIEILVPNAHPVEYGQPLIKIKPAE